MAITEIGIIECSPSSPLDALRNIFTKDNEVINTWASSKPDLNFEGTWLFEQVENPSVIMMAAKWKDIGAHGVWITSEEHARVLGLIVPHLAMDGGKPKGDLWYLQADVITSAAEGREDEMRSTIPLLDSPIISVGRHFVATDRRDEFSRKFEEVRGHLECFAEPFAVRGSWRIGAEDVSRDLEFVVISGWPSVEKHGQFAEHESFAKYRELLGFATGSEVRHYRRVV